MSNNTDTINVFVSHYHEDEQHIKDLKALMGDKYDMRNSSVTSEKFNRASNPDYIKSLLRPLISWAGTFICLIGEKPMTVNGLIGKLDKRSNKENESLEFIV